MSCYENNEKHVEKTYCQSGDQWLTVQLKDCIYQSFMGVCLRSDVIKILPLTTWIVEQKISNGIEDVLLHLQVTVIQEGVQACCRTETVFNIYHELKKWSKQQNTIIYYIYYSNTCMAEEGVVQNKSQGPNDHMSPQCPSVVKNRQILYHFSEAEKFICKMHKVSLPGCSARPQLHG